jgi:hypothetical protein
MNDKTKPARPADIRGISDPPDMGRLKPAEEVAAESIGRRLWLGVETSCEPDDERQASAELARIIRQSRAEGAAAALEEMAGRLEAKASGYSVSASDSWSQDASSERYGGKFEAYDDAADILRARIKDISDPPDMG